MWSIISKIIEIVIINFVKDLVRTKLNEKRLIDIATCLNSWKNRIRFLDFILKNSRGKR